jgi:predicted lysophospholipase L1 biosynthesis ABC-type transport system permease subunit
MVAVVGVSASAQANLLALIDRLGTNLLTVSPGTTLTGGNKVLQPSGRAALHRRALVHGGRDHAFGDARHHAGQRGLQFTTLLLGLGAVALLVGAIGIANIMFISVLERRGEIGLRRALGATRPHIALQFLAESALLAALGAVAGLAFGAAATEIYAQARNEPFVVPLYALIAAPAAGLAIGALAGLYPAAKASRLSPTEALRA